MTFTSIRQALVILASMTLMCTSALAQMGSRFSYSTDGSEVTDSKTGLVWRRCVEGMVWSGATCTGTPATYTHEQALVRAQSQSGWRLPNVKELASIVDLSRANPSIDSTAFPATPATWFWSSSPLAGYAYLAWVVEFSYGVVSNFNRGGDGYAVRLVR